MLSAAPRSRRVAAAIYLLLAANLLALWLARGDFVNGWDLFGATFGVLALNDGSFTDGVARIARAVLHPRRPVFTGGESLIYGLIPGILDNLHPWLLWPHLLNLVLFVLVSFWIVRRIGARGHVYWACVLASPALVSQSIVGLPDLVSNAIPYSLAIAWVLAERQRARGLLAGCTLDVIVFAVIAAIAFNGYESGKTFFVVPAVAALTVPGIAPLRRLGWLGCAGAVAWLVHSQGAATVNATLRAIPGDALDISPPMLRLLRSFAVEWYIDFPGVVVAAVTSLIFLRANRAFWGLLFVVVCGLVSVNAFELNGAFLVPHRFLLLGFVSALIVTLFLSQASPRRPAIAVTALLVAGIAYTTFVTARFALAIGRDGFRSHAGEKVYPLPYNRAQLDAHIAAERIRDATKLERLMRSTKESHVFFYGFSVSGEDSVNPQLFVSRLLLPLGYREFSLRVRFFDHATQMYFQFPIGELNALPAALADLPTPFYVHVREPEYSADSLIAKYFNRAQLSAVDLGLATLKSYRVERFALPGPIPIAPLEVGARGSDGEADGFCLTTWTGQIAVDRLLLPLPAYLDAVLAAADAEKGSQRLSRRLATRQVAQLEAGGPGAIYFVGHFDNGGNGPLLAQLNVEADCGVGVPILAVTINDQTVIEAREWSRLRQYSERLLLPPGHSVIKVFYRQRRASRGVHFATVREDGGPIRWRCAADFGQTLTTTSRTWAEAER